MIARGKGSTAAPGRPSPEKNISRSPTGAAGQGEGARHPPPSPKPTILSTRRFSVVFPVACFRVFCLFSGGYFGYFAVVQEAQTPIHKSNTKNSKKSLAFIDGTCSALDA